MEIFINMVRPDISKFHWPEIFNDSKGRTSAGRIVGFMGAIVSLIVFGVSSLVLIFKHTEIEGANALLSTITMQSIALFTVSVALLGVRRITKDADTDIGEDPVPVEEEYVERSEEIYVEDDTETYSE